MFFNFLETIFVFVFFRVLKFFNNLISLKRIAAGADDLELDFIDVGHIDRLDLDHLRRLRLRNTSYRSDRRATRTGQPGLHHIFLAVLLHPEYTRNFIFQAISFEKSVKKHKMRNNEDFIK